MQTFLPLSSFYQSASCLDYRRLGKQRVECKQILFALQGKTKGWVNHPATKMWKGYEGSLILYATIICEEWLRRGYKDNQLKFFLEEYGKIEDSYNKFIFPHWFGDDEFHASHRSNLLRKDKEFYSKFGWPEEDGLEYIWPKGRE